MAQVQINVYGKLRTKFPLTKEIGTRGIIEVDIEEGETLESVFNRVGIRPEELYTIFLNHELLTTKNSMATHLGYQQYCEDCHNWDLCVKLKDGDTVAIFGFDMANLVI